jgi:hypothetical protein
MSKEYPVQLILELACASQRVNKDYLKELVPVYTSDNVLVAWQQPNKTHILFTLGEISWGPESDQLARPELLKVLDSDKELANEIRQHFRKLAFAAMQGENEFLTKVNSLLYTENMSLKDIGYVACLPQTYKRDYAQTQVKKLARKVDDGYLGSIGDSILDKDCNVIESQRSKNFDAWNITAIIDNKMVSWFSKTDLKLGACVVIKAKVKDHSKHWKHENPVTRLNYVKAAQ